MIKKKLLDIMFGKHRKNPCEKCNNPYHRTKEHKWWD